MKTQAKLIQQVFLQVLLCSAAMTAARAADDSQSEPSTRGPGASPIAFTEVAESAGLSFVHQNGASPEKFMPETMGGGGLFLDFDNDGWLDIVLVQGGSIATPDPPKFPHALFRNRGDGTFEDRTQRAGLHNPAYGMGACAGDVDGDGKTDLYFTNVGSNVLYRNQGDGTFVDITATSGADSPLWSTSCAFTDIDADGDLDLYIANYVDFTRETNKFCGDHVKELRAYCHPNVYNGQPDALLRNDGKGKFTDVTRAAGIFNPAGKGLGVVVTDLDGDRRPDIYVGNDSVLNFLYRNLGDGKFEEEALLTGVAVNAQGQPEAGMGVDSGDFDNNGQLDLFVTNLDMETNTFYRSLGGGLFSDDTSRLRLAEPSLRYVGFGTVFFDADNDGDLDLGVANGHILDNATQFRDNIGYAQQNLLFRNQNGVFEEIEEVAGGGFGLVAVSRAMAAGDYDNDGDLDLLIVNNGAAAHLLRNETKTDHHSLTVALEGVSSNRRGVGATLRLQTAGGLQLRELKAGSSYLSQNDPRAHFGLGPASQAEQLEVHWPSGKTEVVKGLKEGRIYTLREGQGVVSTQPYASSSDGQPLPSPSSPTSTPGTGQ